MPQITNRLREQGVEVFETNDLGEAVRQSEVLYVTRIQKERFAEPAQYEALKGSGLPGHPITGRPIGWASLSSPQTEKLHGPWTQWWRKTAQSRRGKP